MQCMDRASLEQLLDQGLSLAEIGRRFGRHEATVSYWVKKHGVEAANRAKHVSRGGIAREDLEVVVEAGKSIAEIAEAVCCSKATVRHWLLRYGLKTHNGRGRRPSGPAKAAKQAGLATVTMHCARHGETDFWLDGRGYYRCKRCRSAAVARRRRKVKTILVEEAGGVCCICGYDRNMRALHFHHVDPSQKRHEMNAKGVAIASRSCGSRRRSACFCALIATRRSRMGSGPSRQMRWTERMPLRGSTMERSGVAQLAEYSAVNRTVVGSSPTPGAPFRTRLNGSAALQ
jgi:transposase